VIDDGLVNKLVRRIDNNINDTAWLLRLENRGLSLDTARAIAQTAAIARIPRSAAVACTVPSALTVKIMADEPSSATITTGLPRDLIASERVV
jgi:hypothetical protein